MSQTENAKQNAERLKSVVINAIPKMQQFNVLQWKYKQDGKWSKLEILGHLIDSANNNHQRFIRARSESVPVIAYEQEVWNQFGAYNNCNPDLILGLWANYNMFLSNLIEHMNDEDMQKLTTDGKNEHSLEFIVKDYIDHMEHHLNQILSGELK